MSYKIIKIKVMIEGNTENKVIVNGHPNSFPLLMGDVFFGKDGEKKELSWSVTLWPDNSPIYAGVRNIKIFSPNPNDPLLDECQEFFPELTKAIEKYLIETSDAYNTSYLLEG